jgi:hypothetical protein
MLALITVRLFDGPPTTPLPRAGLRLAVDRPLVPKTPDGRFAFADSVVALVLRGGFLCTVDPAAGFAAKRWVPDSGPWPRSEVK